MSSFTGKTLPNSRNFTFVYRHFALALLLGSSIFSTVFGQKKLGQVSPSLTRIQWNRQHGVTTYRLQIASDEQFKDILFDGRVTGAEYVTSDLAPGVYYWRVAPSDFETGRFLHPIRLAVTTANAEVPASNPSLATRNHLAVSGWLAALGNVAAVMAASLRPQSSPDFISVNSQGTVYAIDSSRGTALWAARFQRDTRQGNNQSTVPSYGFRPIITSTNTGSSIVIVLYEKGLRALEGATGRELWRTELLGEIKGGVIVPDRGETLTVYLTNKTSLMVLDALTGKIETQTKLTDESIGPPVFVDSKQRLLIPLRDGVVEMRKPGRESVQSIRIGSEITTAPNVLQTPRGPLMVIGTQKGIAVFDTKEFRPLHNVELANDEYPVGSLSSADLDGDKFPEVVLITNRSRAMAVDLGSRKIRWSAEVASGASSTAFEDVNGDGHIDVLVPGKTNFAIALSGVDGSTIWQSAEQSSVGAKLVGSRSLAAVRLPTGHIMIAGSDLATSSGLRAIEVRVAPPISNVRSEKF